VSWVVSLVEDDDAIREELRDILIARGLQVVEARHGGEALEAVRRRGVRPALLLVDLMMPVMSGWELLEAQASEPLLAGVPVIVMTAHEPGESFPATVHAVFRKPFALASLLAEVRRLTADISGPMRPPARGTLRLDADLVLRGERERKGHPEGSAEAQLALDPDAGAVRVDDSLRDRESEAGALVASAVAAPVPIEEP
jgi:CheY-like chemotaxis protein